MNKFLSLLIFLSVPTILIAAPDLVTTINQLIGVVTLLAVVCFGVYVICSLAPLLVRK